MSIVKKKKKKFRRILWYFRNRYTAIEPFFFASDSEIFCFSGIFLGDFGRTVTCFCQIDRNSTSVTTTQIFSLPPSQFGSKKHLEYVRNIEYSIYESFQSVWVEIGEDISTGQKVGPVNMWGHVSITIVGGKTRRVVFYPSII